MKKVFSMLLVAVMLLSAMSVSAFAAEITTDGDTSHDVYAKYAEGSTKDAYKVTISWDSMKFVYSANTTEWDVDTHEWKETAAASWAVATGEGNSISLTNHSSQDVKASFTFAPVDDTGVTGGTFTSGGETVTSITIDNAQSGEAKSASVTFMPTGDLVETTDNTNAFAKVGAITIMLDTVETN